MQVLLGQLCPVPGDVAANVGAITGALGEHPAAELAVFPELFLGGYDLARVAELATDVAGPVIGELRAAALGARTALVGISGWMNPRTEIDYCRKHGITVIWLEDIWEHGAAWAAERAREVAGAGDGIYLSFDVDALDAAYAPGTCCPSPGGLTSREAIEIVRGVSREGLLGVDVVETAPSLEATPSTSLIAGRVAIEAMAFHAGAGNAR